MSGGMIGSGQVMKSNALQSMQRYSSLEAKMQADKNTADAMNAQAEKQQNASLGAAAGGVAGGVAAGAMYGTSAGPIGVVIGAIIGGIAGSLF